MSERDDLLRLRRIIWSSIREAVPEKRAPLMREYRTVSARIEELKTGKATGDAPTQPTDGGDEIDELTARRASRNRPAGAARRPAARDG